MQRRIFLRMSTVKLFFVATVFAVFFGGVSFASAATIFQDDFETGFSSLETHAPNTGTGWTKIIDNNMGLIVQSYDKHVTPVSNGTGVGSLYTANGTYSIADYEILAHINFAGAGDSNYGRWLAIRVQDANNFYALRVGGTMKIYKRVAGTWTELASTSNVPTISNTTSPYRADWFSLRAEGTTLSATINGVQVLSVTDSAISSAGTAGLGLGKVNNGITDNAGTGVGLDNVLVRTIVADTIVAPTTQASTIATSSITQTTATLSWVNGDGAKRAVFLKTANTGTSAPADNQSYTAMTRPTAGSQIGTTGWYAVYGGTGTTVSLTNLSATTQYIAHVVEYNGDQAFEKYLTTSASDNPLTFTTLSYQSPTVSASNVSAGNISGKAGTVSWTSGNGANRIVFVKEGATSGEAAPSDSTSYTANSTFGSGTQIGTTGWYAVYKGTGASVSVTGLDSTKAYRFHVVEYNGTTGVEKYLASSATNNPITKSAYAGTTIYSNYTSGNDTNGTGTSGAPYKTFHKAYTSAIDGDTLNLAGTFSWSNADETGDLSTSGYTLSKNNLTIIGAGAGTTIIQANPADNVAVQRIFTIPASVSTTIQNLTIRYGKTSTGGCLNLVASSTVLLRGVDIFSCRSTSSGGGAIYANSTGASVTIENSSVTNNSAGTSGYGGAIFMGGASGVLTVTNSTFTGNIANGNTGYAGAAIYFSGTGSIGYLTNSTFTGNSAYNGTVAVSSAVMNFKNTVVSGNSSNNTAAFANLHRSGGSLVSNGYNIFGIYNTSYFSATTTGDWADQTGSGTYTLYSVGTTGTLSLAATTTAANGTVYAPLSTGSIGINHGTTVAHGSVSIPATDQLGLSRNGATDIGAYEYGGTNDSTAPTVSLTLPVDGATIYGSTIGMSASASDDTAVAGVKFYVNNILVGSEDTTSPYTIVWNSLSATTSGSKTVVAVARDISNNYATSTAHTVTLANQPAPSSITASTSVSAATITWTTPVESSSRMFFGFVNGLASSTLEQNTGTKVTNHSIDISGLPACAVYKYYSVSKNDASEIATSTQSTFKTAGCSGGASITANNEDNITTASGGTLTQDVLSLTIPASFTSTSSQATFQAKKLDGSTFFANVTGPSGKNRAGATVYNLSAYTDTSTPLSTFSTPLTVTLSYTDSDISGLDESTLKIQRYDSSIWSELSSCTVNTSANTVSCTTTAFSDFGIFGDSSPESEEDGELQGSTSGSGIHYGCKDMKAANYQYFARHNQSLCVYATSTVAVLFIRDLEFGSVGEDVRVLQNILITHNHTIPAGATGYFGKQTQSALAEFQAQNSIIPALGYFGPKTRAFMNSMRTSAVPEVSAVEPASPAVPDTITSNARSAPFTRDLWLKDKGSDVRVLQTLLIQKGHAIRAGATGYFGEQTREALAVFQKENGIAPASGYFGSKTRAFIADRE